MQETFRHERDKFQTLTDKLTASIHMYLSGASPDVVINNVHAAHSILMDLNEYFCGRKNKRFKNDPPSKLIQEPQYFSIKLDSLYEGRFCRRKFIDGKAGLYPHLGNVVKHADYDPQAVTAIFHQHAFEYLYILVRDYQLLKDALLEADIVKRQREFLNRSEPTLASEAMGTLSRKFLRVAGLRVASPLLSKPLVDISCNLFLGWVNMINEDFATIIRRKINPDYKPSDLWDIEDRSAFGFRERVRIRHAMRSGLLDNAHEILDSMLKEKFGMAPAGQTESLKQESRPYIKEMMRNASKYTLLDILNERTRKYSWRGPGYYLDVNGKEPQYPYVVIDKESFEYLEISALE